MVSVLEPWNTMRLESKAVVEKMEFRRRWNFGLVVNEKWDNINMANDKPVTGTF